MLRRFTSRVRHWQLQRVQLAELVITLWTSIQESKRPSLRAANLIVLVNHRLVRRRLFIIKLHNLLCRELMLEIRAFRSKFNWCLLEHLLKLQWEQIVPVFRLSRLTDWLSTILKFYLVHHGGHDCPDASGFRFHFINDTRESIEVPLSWLVVEGRDLLPGLWTLARNWTRSWQISSRWSFWDLLLWWLLSHLLSTGLSTGICLCKLFLLLFLLLLSFFLGLQLCSFLVFNLLQFLAWKYFGPKRYFLHR